MTFDDWWNDLGVKAVRPTYEIAKDAWNNALAQRAEEKPTLDAIAAELNGMANAMASCLVVTGSQLAYWRQSVEKAYDLARGVRGPETL